MTPVEQITEAIRRLPPEDRGRVKDWLDQFAADEWDRQIERDAAAGKLDWLIEQALADDCAGLSRPL